MQTKKNFKSSLQIIAILFVTLLASFTFLNIFKTNKLSALEDEISFVVGTTSIKETNASILSDGTYQTAYENAYKERYTLDPQGTYVLFDGKYYNKTGYPLCDKDGNTGDNVQEKDHILIDGSAVILANNLYKKDYIHGYNYISFADFIKVPKTSASHILIEDENYYFELITGSDGNSYKSYEDETHFEIANKIDEINFVKYKNQIYELTDINSYATTSEAIDYSYNIYKLITDNKTGVQTMELFNYKDVDKDENTTTPLLAKNEDKESAYIPTYKSYLNNNLETLYIECSKEDSTIEIEIENEIKYFRPLFDKIYAKSSGDLVGGNSIQENIPFITLDNYAKKANLDYGFTTNENIQNLYVSFGEVFIEGINDPTNKVVELNISASLENKYYAEAQNLKIDSPIIQELPNGNQHNYFWFQYFDASNIEAYDNSTGETTLITHPEGLYTFKFSGQYLDSAGKTTAPFNYSYSVYLNSNDNNNSYPSFNEEFINNEAYVYSGEMENKDAYETFFYNFQEDYFPTYTYDASIFDITINRNLNLSLSSKSFEFESLNYSNNFPDGPLREKEYGLVSEYDNDVLSKETLIIAEKYNLSLADISKDLLTDIVLDDEENPENNFDAAFAYSYTYRYRTENLRNINDANTINYFSKNWGTFQQKILVVIFQENNSNTSIIKTYKITNKDKVTDGAPLQGVATEDLIKKEKISKQIKVTTDANPFSALDFEDTNIIITFDKPLTQKITTSYQSISELAFDNGIYKEQLFDTTLPKTIENSATISMDYFRYTKDEIPNFSYSKGTQTSEKQTDIDYKDVQDSMYSKTSLTEFEFEFMYDVVFDELGVYDIENRYAQSISAGTNLTGDLNQGLYSHLTTSNNPNILKYVTDASEINSTYNPMRDYTYQKANPGSPGNPEILPINYQKFGYTLHVFGIKSYFNNNGVKSEFKNDELGIYSDATNAVLQTLEYPATISPNSKQITLKESGEGTGKYYPIINIPVTNMSPITFDYFGTYSYNGIIPISKYYKYDFKYDEEGKVYIVGNPTTHYFTKDTFPSDDGYYEIIAEYKYADYDEIKTGKAQGTSFHQVFSFVIDNSSPTLTFEKMVEVIDDETSKHLEWTTFGKDDFTNNAVRVSWAQTSYFQYPVIPSIYKTNFDGIEVGKHGSASTSGFINVSNDLRTEYKVGYYVLDSFGNKLFKSLISDSKENIYLYKYDKYCLYDVPVLRITLDGIVYENIYPTDFLNTEFVETIENAEAVSIIIKKRVNQLYITTTNTVEYVDPAGNKVSNISNDIWGSGKYQVRLQYGYQSKSYLTQGFTIDNTDITGLNILPVDLNGEQNVVSQGTFSNNMKNLIKDPFTFIYNAKPSGASIEASYTVIPFSSNINKEKLNLYNSLAGITGTELINSTSSSASVVNHYSYDYTFKNPGDPVYSSNIFTPTNSALYIFNLKDSAGNIAEYFVSFDLSAPNFFIAPENEGDLISEYNVITGLTDVAWGDYKAIEITPQANGFNDGFIFGNSPNYLASNVEKMMRNIYKNENSDIYSGAKLVRTWTLFDGTIEQIPEEFLAADKTIDYNQLYRKDETNGGVTITHYYKDEAQNIEIISSEGIVEVRYFILINIRNVNFTYYNTNSDDNSIYSFDYKLNNGKLAKNSTVLSPTRKALIRYWAEKGVTVQESQILADSTHEYGFYGEKKYIYVITDILGNEAGNSLWMNLDLTLAMAFGNFSMSDKELTVSTNVPLTQLTPYSAYAASQVYFSWLVDDGTSQNNSIPESKIDYKFFDFDLDFYNNYIVTGITLEGDNYTFRFQNINDPETTKTVVISTKDLKNYNGDGERVNEPVSMYPYELQSSGWTTIMESTADSDELTMAHNGNRFYSPILRASNAGSFTVSDPGLYLFRRVYTDYIDANGVVLEKDDQIGNGNADDGIGDDTVYRYYLYYIDRNGIIDLSTSALKFLLGAGMNDEEYTKEYSQENIKDVSINSTSENISYSSMKVDKLFLSNKEVVQMSLTMDKYNQPFNYSNFLNLKDYSKGNSTLLSSNLYVGDSDTNIADKNVYNAFIKLINKYMFGINDTVSSSASFNASKYFNDKFLLKLDMDFGTSTNPSEIIGYKEGKYNTIDPELDNSNRFLLDSLTTRPAITTAKNRQDLKDGILLTKTNINPLTTNPTPSYSTFIQDSAGIIEGSDMSQWGKYSNELSVKFGITSDYPDGYYFGKYSENQNLYASTSANDDAYAEALFRDITSSLTTNTLQDLNITQVTKNNIANHYIVSNTNNEALIFYFEKTKDNEAAQIEPYEVILTRTMANQASQVLFKVTLVDGKPVYSGLSGYTQERLKKALVSNETPTTKADKWALVVFDNFNGGNYRNLLSDSKYNATYEVSIQFKGIKEDYSSSSYSNTYYFNSVFEITVDNVKPLYNLIKLMENDIYIPNKEHSKSLPAGYTNIDDYYAETLAGLNQLEQQAALEQIYEYYMEGYYIKSNNGSIEYFKNSKGEDYVTYNGSKIAKSYIQNYFFGVDDEFTFSKVGEIDTSKIYYRQISNSKNYNFSLTKDDFPTTASESTFKNNPIFDPNALSSLGFGEIDIAESEKSITECGLVPGNYYEIIEKDTAGNYRVYAIFYGQTTQIDYSFNFAKFSIFEGGNTGTLNNTTTYLEVFGTDLALTTTSSNTNDKFLKAEIGITYSASKTQNNGLNDYKSTRPIEIYLNPIDSKIIVNKNGNSVAIPESIMIEVTGDNGKERLIIPNLVTGNLVTADLTDLASVNSNDYPNIFLSYITAICHVITSNNKGISDFSLDISLLNRLGEIYNIDYNYPGEELKYIKNGYNITIPKDEETRATKIIGLEISRYQNGAFNKIIRDANNKDIISENGGASLGGVNGVTYTLSNGTYKLVLTDNFGRVSTYYETYDVNSVKYSIAYSGPTSYIDTDLYTAKTTTITYDPSLYIPVFFITDDVTLKTRFFDDANKIPTDSYYRVTTSSTSTTQTTIGKITFNQESSHHTKFNVILLRIENLNADYYNAVSSLGDDINIESFKKILEELDVVNHEYKFILYTKLPTIQLKNLNGGIIANNNNQILIEDLIIIWTEKYNDGLTYDFNAKLKMRRYYNGSNYNQIISTNNYKITLPGDYFIVLTNDLGYESEEIRFTRAEGSTILYSVYTKTSDGYSTQLFESSYTTTYNGKIVYHYYALNNFNNLNSDGSPIKTKDHIDIITNTNNKISYTYIGSQSNLNGTNLAQGETAHAFYEIFSLSPDGTNKFVFRYIQVNFIEKALNDFSNLKLLYQTTNEGTTLTNSISFASNIIKSTKNEVLLFFETLGYNQVIGNSITLTHYFNGQFVESVRLEDLANVKYSIDGAQEATTGYMMSIKTGGLHRFELTDLAGNIARFGGYQYLNICLINSIVYNINENEPVDGEIFNSDVILEVFTKLENTTLYEDYTIEVFRNSLEHEYEIYGLHTYRFTQAGYYLVRLTASVQLATNLPSETIVTTFSFKIINPQTTLHTFDISSGNNFKVISIEKKIDFSEETDFVPLPLQSSNEVWLSAEDEKTGTGVYRITLQAYVEGLKQYRNFSFNVWLSSAVPSITASIAFGTATTDPITLTYNEKTIFDSIGESKIVINDVVITNITAASIDENKTFKLETSGEYWVQILTDDDKLVASYKLTKNEPLNSNAKIVIIIVVCVAIALTIVFIVIRRKTRFK